MAELPDYQQYYDDVERSEAEREYGRVLARRERRRPWVRGALLVLLVIALALGFRWALDDAEGHEFWISNGGYTDPQHPAVGCCGEGDCKELDARDVTSTPSGYLIRSLGETVPYSEAYPSEDGKTWRCKRHDGSRRCFFSPMPGS